MLHKYETDRCSGMHLRKYGYPIEKYGFDMLDIHMVLSSLKCIHLAC